VPGGSLSGGPDLRCHFALRGLASGGAPIVGPWPPAAGSADVAGASSISSLSKPGLDLAVRMTVVASVPGSGTWSRLQPPVFPVMPRFAAAAVERPMPDRRVPLAHQGRPRPWSPCRLWAVRAAAVLGKHRAGMAAGVWDLPRPLLRHCPRTPQFCVNSWPSRGTIRRTITGVDLPGCGVRRVLLMLECGVFGPGFCRGTSPVPLASGREKIPDVIPTKPMPTSSGGGAGHRARGTGIRFRGPRLEHDPPRAAAYHNCATGKACC
jgi:hypothetical protein